MDFLLQPWPWYVSGPLIAIVMFLLLYSGKNFGMSSNLRTMCSACGADRFADFFKFDWKNQRWNLVVVLGTMIGGFIAAHYLTPNKEIAINSKTKEALTELGFENPGDTYLPPELFSQDVWTDPVHLFYLVLGGLLVGFGARYAGGCTSGHAISGLSNLQLPSLIAVIGFFIGGLLMIHVIFPFIF